MVGHLTVSLHVPGF